MANLLHGRDQCRISGIHVRPGQSVDWKHGIKVVEDCAQAHGACWKGRSVGTFGDIGTWSFCQDKIMSTGGEGGMVTTNDQSLWDFMWSNKDHGKKFSTVFTESPQPGFRPVERLPMAKKLGVTSLMFLVHPTLQDEHIDLTIAAIQSVDAEIQADRLVAVGNCS